VENKNYGNCYYYIYSHIIYSSNTFKNVFTYSFMDMKKENKILYSFLIGIVGLLIIYFILQSSISGLLKFIFSVMILYFIGMYYKKEHRLDSFYGFLLLRSKRGLDYISDFSIRFSKYIAAFADISYAMLVGLTFLFFAKWLDIKKRVLALLTAFLIMFILSIITPLGMIYFAYFSDIPKPINERQSLDNNILMLVFFLGGVILAMVYLLINAAFMTLNGIIEKLMGKEIIVQQGVALILPGINIPLFEGIFALAVLLIVHEFSHGIAALIHRIKLKNTGLVLFGSLPIGAFVEVDEKKLFSSDRKIQVRVLASGIGANFVTAIFFSVLFIIFLILTKAMTINGCYGYIDNKVSIFMDKASPCIKFGHSSLLRYYKNPFLNFIYNFLGLAVALNILVAFINALPMPIFDGGYLVKASLGDNILYKLLLYLSIISFIILIIPAFL